jgi:hypothetical protein
MSRLWRLFILGMAVVIVSGITVAVVAPPSNPVNPRAPMIATEGRLNTLLRERPAFTVAALVELLRNAIIITALVVVVAPFVPLLRKPPKRPYKP